MKRGVCLALSALLALSLTGCGTPRFSADALTPAQSYAKAAMDDYKIAKGYDVKEIRVLLTEDLKTNLSEVELKDWDVSDVTAAVVVQPGREGEEATENDQPLLFLLDAEENVVYQKAPSGEQTAAGDSGESLSDLRRQVAQAQLDAENLAEKSEEVKAFAAQAEKKYKADETYLVSGDFLTDCGGKPELLQYGEALRAAKRLEKRLDTLSDCPSTERREAGERLDSDEEMQDQLLELNQMLQKVQTDLAAQDQEVLARLREKIPNAAEDPSVLFAEEYMRLCLGSKEGIACDSLLRQQVIEETSLAALEQCLQTEDLEEREYIEERNAAVVTAMADYAAALYDSIQTEQTLKEFETAHAQEITDFQNGEKEIKDRVGEDYADDVDYIKLQLKYESMLQEKTDLDVAAQEARKKAEQVKSDAEADVKKLDQEEETRRQEVAAQAEQDTFYEYICAMKAPEATEYQAESGQWGTLNPDYIAYQNENLNYASSGSSSSYRSSGSSTSGSSRSSGTSGSSGSSGSGSSDYSFEDYLRDNDPDAYESYQDLERNWNSGNWDPENGFFGE